MSDEPESISIYPNIPQGFAIIAIMVAATILLSPLLMIAENPPWQQILYLLYYAASMGGTLWFINNMKKRLEGSAGFSMRAIPIAAFPLLLLGAVGVEMLANPLVDLIPVPENMEKWLAESIQQKDVYTFLLMVVAAPVIEELIFRGIILDGFLRQFTPSQAIFASSFLFGFAHLNPWQFISGLFLGLAIGWVYYRTRSLLPCMFMHATANALSFGVRFFIGPEDVNRSTAELLGGALNYTVLLFFALMITALSYWALQKLLPRIPDWQNASSL